MTLQQAKHMQRFAYEHGVRSWLNPDNSLTIAIEYVQNGEVRYQNVTVRRMYELRNHLGY